MYRCMWSNQDVGLTIWEIARANEKGPRTLGSVAGQDAPV